MTPVEQRLRKRIEAEARVAGFDAYRAVQTLFEEIVNPGRYARSAFWVGYGMLGHDASGNIALVGRRSLEDPWVRAKVRQFNAIKAAAQSWPETRDYRLTDRADLRATQGGGLGSVTSHH